MLDYSGFPFRCNRCHRFGHLATACLLSFRRNEWIPKVPSSALVRNHGQFLSLVPSPTTFVLPASSLVTPPAVKGLKPRVNSALFGSSVEGRPPIGSLRLLGCLFPIGSPPSALLDCVPPLKKAPITLEEGYKLKLQPRLGGSE